MKHSFGYVGVPKEFRIIIQKADGELQVSSIVTNKYFNAVVRYNMKTNKILSVKGGFLDRGMFTNNTGFSTFALRLAITVLIEILIFMLFFHKKLSKIPVYIKTFGGGEKQRTALYTAAANLASFAAGILLW